MRLFSSLGSLVLALGTGVAGAAQAITIVASTDATTLVNALLASANTGIVVSSATLNAHTQLVDVSSISPGTPPQQMSSAGTYTNASGTYGIGSGVVLSTGGVEGIRLDVAGTQFTALPGYGDGPNTTASNSWAFGTTTFPPAPPDPNAPGGGLPGVPATAAQEALLDPITSNPDCSPSPTFCDHFDVSELLINFDMQPGFEEVRFSIVFGSEEWEEFRDSSFVDGFGMFLNGVNIATIGGFPVNIQHPDTKPALDANGVPIPGTEISGTELDGILAPGGVAVLTFAGPVNPTGNTLRFIVADTSDGIYDTTVYFSALQGVPAPPAAWLLAAACVVLGARRARRTR